mgnify:CR=1 FL=1
MSEMVRCINCKHLERDGWCGQVADSPHEELDRRCDFFKKCTNGDRIRRMTDEELAKFLCNIAVNPGRGMCELCIAASNCRAGHNGFLDWLKEEHNVEK